MRICCKHTTSTLHSLLRMLVECRCQFADCFRLYKHYAHSVRAYGFDAAEAGLTVWTDFSDKNVLLRSGANVQGLTKKQVMAAADYAFDQEIAAIDCLLPAQAVSKDAKMVQSSVVVADSGSPRSAIQRVPVKSGTVITKLKQSNGLASCSDTVEADGDSGVGSMGHTSAAATSLRTRSRAAMRRSPRGQHLQWTPY